jgi:hypothetical protein
MPNYSKKFVVKTTTPRQGFNSINWEAFRDVYVLASKTAEQTALAELEGRVQHEQAKLNKLFNVDSESGAYEGNYSDAAELPELDPKLLLAYKDKAGQAAVKSYVEVLGLAEWSHVFMPEIITLLAGMTLKRNENGLISGLKFRNENFTTPLLRGLYYFLKLDARSSYLKTQYKAPNSSYCSLVPTIMYAHKLVHGVKYSEWDPTEIEYVVHPQLAEAMLYVPCEMTIDEIMHERTEGLTVRSGPTAGKIMSAVWKHKLAGPQLKQGIFKDTPYLAQVMLAQIWCAHPDNRSAYMILDPVNWDLVPKALISTDIMAMTTIPFTSSNFTKSPSVDGWDE